MSDLRDRIVEIIGTSDAYTEPGDAADAILALVAERMRSEAAIIAAAENLSGKWEICLDEAPHALTAALQASGIVKGEGDGE